jgi:hypothetical protein
MVQQEIREQLVEMVQQVALDQLEIREPQVLADLQEQLEMQVQLV